MAEQEKKVKKLTEQELLNLRRVKEEYKNIKHEFGEIALLKINVDQRQTRAEQYFEDLKKSESTLTQSLFEKYGPGNINIDTGEIT